MALVWYCWQTARYLQAVTSDLIEEGVTGFIVDPYDEKQFSETIETLMNNPVKAAEMGKAGLERSKEFSFEKVSKGFIEAVHAAPN